MNAPMKLDVLIPVRNQTTKLLANLRNKVLPYFDSKDITYDILICSDHSNPQEQAALVEGLKAFPPQVKLLPYEDKAGKGYAVRKLILAADGDYVLFMVNRDGNAKPLTLPLPPFTLVGATTRAGDLSSPLRARFGISEKIDFYPPSEIAEIIRRTALVFSTPIEPKAVDLIAKRSRGTPRIANRIYKRVRDFATYNGQTSITYEEAKSALDALKIDELGLDDVDIKYLTTIIERFHGGPVGLEAIASSIGEEIMNLEDVYEPYLLMIGMINRTPRGRTATEKAYEHLKKAHQGTLL